MKVDICSRNGEFLRSCRSALEIWSTYICADLELAQTERWEALTGGDPAERKLLFLDAEHLNLSDNQKQLEQVFSSYGAVFVCARDSRKAIALYRLRSTTFLRMPLSAAVLDRAMSRCVSVWQSSLKQLELTENRSRLRLPMCDILWAEAQGRNCMLHGLCRDVQIGEPMNELTGQLPGEVFIRCQRSYLVNLHHVRDTDGKFVYMTNGETISVGRSSRQEVLEAVARCRAVWNEQIGDEAI